MRISFVRDAEMWDALIAVAALAVVLVAMSFAGYDDRLMAEQTHSEYCARVAAGVHTDYDELCGDAK